MSILLSDVLHYWDYRTGSAEPIIGGSPSMSRAGNAFNAVRPALSRVSVTDTPRIGHDGLRLELSQTNKVTDPFDLSTANWLKPGGITVTGVTSLYDGKTGNLLTDATSTENSRVLQNIGTFTANPETVIWDVEEQTASKTRLLIWDATALTQQIDLTLTWSTLSLATSGSGTAQASGIVKLADRGPNGKQMYRIWGTFTPVTSGNSGQVYVWSDPDAAGGSNAVYWVGYYETDTILGSAVDGTRVTETFYWNDPPPPQAMIVYGEYIALMKDDGGISSPRVWAIEDGTGDPSTKVVTTGVLLLLQLNNGTDGNVNVSATLNQLPGDRVRWVAILNADSSGRLILKKNDDAAAGGNLSASASGLPTAWASDAHALNSLKNGSAKGATTTKQIKILKQGNQQSAVDGSGTGDEDLITEMEGLVVSDDGSTVYNINL